MIERTADEAFIRSIVTHPACWDTATDDDAGPRENWKPPMGANLHWVRIPGVDAVALLYQVSGVIWAYDAAMLPQARGGAQEYGVRRSYIERLKGYLRQHTNCRKLIAIIACDNARSIRAAKADGLKPEGLLTAAKQRGGVMVDAVIYATEV